MNNKRLHRLLATLAIITIVGVASLLIINTDPVTANGQDSDNGYLSNGVSQEENARPSGSNFYTSALPSVARMVGALLVVIVCIYLGLYLLKRVTMRRYSGNGSHRLLEVLETTCVAPKKTVSLIKVANKAVLVGVTDSQMSVLAELNPAETAEIIATQGQEKESRHFSELLKSVSHRLRRISVKKDCAALET